MTLLDPRFLLVMLLALVPALPGQVEADVEPTHEAAVERLVARVVEELPHRAPSAEGLHVIGRTSAARGIARAVERGLQAEGFRVLESGDGGSFGFLATEHSDDRGGALELMALADPEWVIRVAHGRAGWTLERDAPVRVVLGHWHPAVDGARRTAWTNALEAFARACDVPSDTPGFERALRRLDAESFVSSRVVEGVRLHRVHLGIPADDRSLSRLTRAIAHAAAEAREEAWRRGGAGALASLLLGLLYLRLDLATRGYMTGRLRLLFLLLLAGAWVFALKGPLG